MTLYTERDLNRSTSKESKNLMIRLSLEQMVRASKTLLNAFEHLPGLLMSRKDRILVFLSFFFCIYLKRLEVEIEMVNGYP